MKDYIKPKARTNELVVSQLADETLVYDLQSHQAYCLNSSAAAVWNLCDGARTVEQLSAELKIDKQINEAVVGLALGELERFELLERSSVKSKKPNELPVNRRMSRREAIQLFGVAAAAALPVITTLVAPPSANAASLKANGEPCADLGSEYASKCCDTRVCRPEEWCNTEARRKQRGK